MPRCPSCSAELADDSRFCNACGSEVGALPDSMTRTSATRTAPSHSISHTSLDQARFTAGTLLDDRYRIIGLLGKGGMGEVYRAEDLKLGQPVALKFLPVAMEKDDSRLQRLLNEVRLARQVSHPNVCSVYDVGEVDGSHFMAMEYVDGEDLASLLRRIGRLPHEKAIEISRQICAGLAAAHEQGILHRDLKPANVMIDGRGRVKLADFGLANLTTGIEGEEARAGTPAYMAPEQLAGREVTQRSDIFSLGLVLYEIFTGQQAVRGKSLEEIAAVHGQGTLTNPSTLVNNVDDIVEQVILRCLEKEPGARPASALAVAAALPGGDPLAAALAAGETPSPEMVAEAGSRGGLKSFYAIGAMIGVILALVLSVENAQNNDLEHKIPMETPPTELATMALATLADLGVDEPGRHRRYGFGREEEYLNWLDDQDPPAEASVLQSESPPAAHFWYRYSASEMEPHNLHAYSVYRDDPTQNLPGMGRLRLDFQGRLLQFERIADRDLDQDRAPLSWSVLFAAAGLNLDDFTPTETIRAPLAPCDEVMAWKGPVFEGVDGVVQAGMVGGQPTYFEIMGPWHLAGDMDSQFPGTPFIMGLAMFGIIVTALVLARRNLKAGRSDTRSAAILTIIFLLSVFATWILTEVRLGTLDLGSIFAQVVFGRLLAHGLVHGATIGIFYIALEPYVRRLWPESLVSWSRLMMGRFKDPLVGRDLLVGMAFLGALSALTTWLGTLLQQGAGVSQPLGSSYFSQGLVGVPYALSDLIRTVESSFGQSVAFLVVLLILRLLLRRTWIAVLGLMVLAIAGYWSSPSAGVPAWVTIAGMVSTCLYLAAMIVCLLRFGLVSLVGGAMMTGAMGSATLTWDFQTWYAGSSLLVFVAVFALAGWAFYTALAGRSLFKDSVLD